MSSPSLSELAAAELQRRRGWRLRFAAAVEDRFEADLGAARRRELTIAGLAGLVVYDLFLLNDQLVRPEVMGLAFGWRGALTLYGLLVLGLIHRGVPARWREGLMASTIVATVVASSAIFLGTTSPAGLYDPFVFSLIFVAGNVAFPLRFVPAVVASALGLAIAAAVVTVSPLMPKDAKAFAIGLMAGATLFTLFATWRIEAWTRRAYLLVLRESLHGEAARRAADHATTLSNTDALTQLPNRRRFEGALARAWQHAEGAAVGLLMIDIDHFKRFNDRFGHPAGDDCLRCVAQAMRGELREGDMIARLGGEEFVVLLPTATMPAAAALAERLRAAVERLAIPHDGGDGRQVVTISVGIALVVPHLGTPMELLESADRALYEAKRAGRNRAATLPPTIASAS